MNDYQISIDRAAYFPGEEIKVRVAIVNGQDAPLQIPDPRRVTSRAPIHRLSGPSYPEGVELTNSALLPGGADPEDAPPQTLTTIEPGGRWEGVFSLTSRVAPVLVGDYRLSSRLRWGEVDLSCEEVCFRLEPLRVSAAHLGLGERPLELGGGAMAFFQQGAGGGRLYTSRFNEVAPSYGEVACPGPIHLIAVGPEAAEVAMPWRNAPYFNEMQKWFVWREGQQVKALHSGIRLPLCIQLPTPAALLVRPPLKVTGEPVEVLLLGEDRRELYLARFSADVRQRQQEATLVWQQRLPVEVDGMTAALAPEPTGSARHVAWLARDLSGEDVTVSHSRYTGGELEPPCSTVVRGVRLVQDAAPALWVDAAGQATVGFLALDGKSGRSCLLVETRFAADGVQFPPRITVLGELDHQPRGGALLYVHRGGALERVEAVMLLEDRQLVKMSSASYRLAPLSLPGAPTSPILLAPGKGATYAVYVHQARGLQMAPI